MQLDALLPLAPPKQPSSSSDSSGDEHSSDAAAVAAAAAAAAQEQYPLQWPRCLFGTAAKLYYEELHAQRQQQQQQQGAHGNGPPQAAAAAAAAAGVVDVEYVQQLLQETCPLEPLQCALTTVLFPDRRCLIPDDEPGNALTDLYYNTTTTINSSSSSSSSSSGGSSSVGGSPSSSSTVGSVLEVCAGAAASVAAAAYDPVPLLLLGLRGLQQGCMDLDSFAVCGLLGVVLRSLAAEDPQLRTLAYDCLSLLTADSAQGLVTPGSDPSQGLVRGGGQGITRPPGQTLDGVHQTNNLGQQAGRGLFGSVPQLLRSSKRVHQMRALLLWVQAGVMSPQQQIPTASAALAAEASLLLCAPHHPMGAVVRKLMVRQRALDTKGLPLFGRILALSSSSSSSSKGGAAVAQPRATVAATGGDAGSSASASNSEKRGGPADSSSSSSGSSSSPGAGGAFVGAAAQWHSRPASPVVDLMSAVIPIYIVLVGSVVFFASM
jgi:hypothetical protein